MGGTGEAVFTDKGTFCAIGFCKLVILPELVGAGTPPGIALDFAISASACRIFDVSVAGAVFAIFPFPPKVTESLGGVPVGVVD